MRMNSSFGNREPGYRSQCSDYATGWTIRQSNPDRTRYLSLLKNIHFLWTTHPPHSMNAVGGDLFLWVKRPDREAQHSPPPSVVVKNERSYTSTPSVRLHAVYRDKFIVAYSNSPTVARYIV
jgi:hypothetical protein